MNVYLSGPMRGYKDHNREAFAEAEQYCKTWWPDAHVTNPGSLEEGPWDDKLMAPAFRRDFQAVSNAHVVVFIGEWMDSEGASAEYVAARLCGCTCYLLTEGKFKFLDPDKFPVFYLGRYNDLVLIEGQRRAGGLPDGSPQGHGEGEGEV